MEILLNMFDISTNDVTCVSSEGNIPVCKQKKKKNSKQKSL